MFIPTHDEEGIWHYGIKNEIVYLKDIGGEYYSEMSNTTNASPVSQRFNTAYLVLDTKLDKSNINFGVVKGTNLNSDTWVLKLIASIGFWSKLAQF